MGDFKLPADFKVEFSKDYEMFGNKFSVGVQYRGQPSLVIHSWVFVIAVNKNIVAAGPYEWATHDDVRLPDEAICNHLASFWGHSAVVTQAQNVPEEQPTDLDQIVFKCAEWMHLYLHAPPHFSDYDIISKFMDETEWSVVLRPNYMETHLVEFYKKAGIGPTEVRTYVINRKLSTIL